MSYSLPQGAINVVNTHGEARERSVQRLKHFSACVSCRKKKLRCDGIQPVCGTCARASRQCLYNDARRGVRKQRTSIKILEARLAELESRNVSQNEGGETEAATAMEDIADYDVPDAVSDEGDFDFDIEAVTETVLPYVSISQLDSSDTGLRIPGPGPGASATGSYIQGSVDPMMPQAFHGQGSSTGSSNSPSVPSLALLSLGLEESLPPQEVQDDLYKLFFANVYAYVPVIHPARFLARARIPCSSPLRPPTCMLYAMWALAASTAEQYRSVQDIFYQRARKYAELDEMKSFGELVCTVQHIQAWSLIYLYESFNMYLLRSFLSQRKAAALCIAAGLHKLDGVGLSTTSYLPPAKDWTELEERRRIFWAVFMADRFTCVGSGFIPAFDEQDVQTDLPVFEEAFESGTFSRGMKLSEALTPAGARNVSILGARAVMGSLFGQIVVHLHRPDPEEKPIDDLGNKFWTTYRRIDNTLTNIAVHFPDSFAAAAGVGDLNVVFMNIAIQACTISLHQAGIFTAGRNPRLAEMSSTAKARCLQSAREMMTVVEEVPDKLLVQTPPFTSFCLYMGARVFVVALKEQLARETAPLLEALRYMKSRLELLKTTRPYTASLIKQLESEMDSLQILNPTGHLAKLPQPTETGSDSSSNHSPVNAFTGIETNTTTTVPQRQAPTAFKHAPSRSFHEISTPDIIPKRPSLLHRANTDLNPTSVPNNMHPVSLPYSFTADPTSVPMDDLAWPLNDNEMDGAHSSGVRSGSAPPTSELGGMSMMDEYGMDHVATHMYAGHTNAGLYSGYERVPRAMEMTFDNSWTPELGFTDLGVLEQRNNRGTT